MDEKTARLNYTIHKTGPDGRMESSKGTYPDRGVKGLKFIVTSDLSYLSIMYLGYYVNRGFLSFDYSQALNPCLQNEMDEKLSHKMKGILLSDSCFILHFRV